MPSSGLLWIIATFISLSVAVRSNIHDVEKEYAVRAPLQHPIHIPPLPILAAEACSSGTLVETSTDTVVITITPSPETAIITVTATAPTATNTLTETTTKVKTPTATSSPDIYQRVTTTSTSTSTVSLPAVTRTTAITCFASPGAITTTPEVCITSTTTRTVTSSITLTATTATSTDTTTITPSTSITTTNTDTVSVSTTTTVTTTPAAATTSVGSVSPTGLRYYDYYPRTFRSGSDFFANVPSIVSGVRNNDGYNISGSIRDINSLGTSSATLNFPDGQSAPGSAFACIFQGYIYPALGAGTYRIRSRDRQIDDVGLVWTGDKAVGSNWTLANVDYGAEWPTTGHTFDSSGSVAVALAANQAVPLTIFWGNTDGPGRADFVVEFAGTTYTNTSQFFVGPCDGSVFRP